MTKTPSVKRGRGRPRKNPIPTYSGANEVQGLLDQIEHLQIQLANYQHREIGWQAVVSYLESKIDGNT